GDGPAGDGQGGDGQGGVAQVARPRWRGRGGVAGVAWSGVASSGRGKDERRGKSDGAGGDHISWEGTGPMKFGRQVREGGLMWAEELRRERGLFDPRREYDACGVGFIADLKGGTSHRLIEDALSILENLEHRGAVGADPIAGDGAGILMQLPHAFLQEEADKLAVKLPKPGHYAVGHIFMPQDDRLRAHCENVWMRIIREEGLEFL